MGMGPIHREVDQVGGGSAARADAVPLLDPTARLEGTA